MSSATPAYRSRALEEEMDKFRSMIQNFASPVPTDYIHTLPPDFVQYAASVRAASGSDAGKSRPRLSLVDVARSMATTQAFGRPMEGFSEDQVRRAFSLGDWEGGSSSPSLRNTAKVPEPIYREIRPIHIRDGSVLSTDQGKGTEEKAAGKKTVEAAPAVPKLMAVQGSVPPTAKRPKLKAGFLKPADSSTALPEAPSSAESAPVLAPPASQPPAPAPSPLVLPPVPKVDVSKLTGQRRVSDLTQPEVLTIAEEVTKKLRAKRGKGMWRRQNPLDTEITRENCAALGIPGYFDVVERSMSLQVINRKIRDSEYRALRDFVDDVELMVQNAKTFNAPAHPVHAFAEETRLLFARLLEGHKKDYALREE